MNRKEIFSNKPRHLGFPMVVPVSCSGAYMSSRRRRAQKGVQVEIKKRSKSSR